MMIAEKTNTAKSLTDFLTLSSGKVSFIGNDALSKALSYLEKNGLPGKKQEEYKYCDLESVIRKKFSDLKEIRSNEFDSEKIKKKDAINIFVVNGNYEPGISDKVNEKEMFLCKLSDLPSEHLGKITSVADPSTDPFIALNTAYAGDGFYLRAGKSSSNKTVRVFYISTAEKAFFINPRNLIEVVSGSQLDLIEEHLNFSNDSLFSNYLSEKIVHESAILRTVTIQDEKQNGFSVNNNHIRVDKKGYYHNSTLTLSGSVVRNNHQVLMNGEYCETHLNGLFLTKGEQLVDNHTLMDHQKPNCESHELYKGVVDDKSTGVFNGKIYVRKDAQKTNAYQSSKNILLSDDGTVNTKPQLEIYADDVKCSHGTSTGKIDESAMFYLNARGISRENANKLLLNAFAGEVLEKIGIEGVKEEIENRLGLN